MGKKKTIEEARSIIEGENGNGCKLLSIEYINNRTPLDILCACGEPFTTNLHDFNNGQKQCKECSKKIKIEKLKGEKVKFNCDYCKKECEQNPSAYKKSKHHFCSVECKCKYISENNIGENNPSYNRVKCKCDNCGQDMKITQYRYDNSKNHFCSKECKAEWQHKYNTGENNPLYKKIKGECDYCHKEIEIAPWEYDRSKNHFCSKECKNNYWSENVKTGEEHPRYNPNLTDEEREKGRLIKGLPKCRNEVYERDNYTCQCCGDNKGGNLNAHHIYSYDIHEDLRVNTNNFITLCEDCHKEFHKIHGYGNNTWQQFREFLYNKYLQTKDLYFLSLIETIDLRFIQLNNKAS